MDYQNEYNSNNAEGKSTGFVRRNVNTNSFTFFSGDKMLSLSFYNDFLSISIAERYTDENGRSKFTPKNERINRIFSRENIVTLLDSIDRDLVPAMVEYTNNSNTGFDDKAVLDLSKCVMNSSKDEISLADVHITIDSKNDVTTELRLHFGINNERIARESKVYEFARSTLISNYDATTGKCDTVEYNSQFMLFKRLLEQFVDSGAHAVSHDINQSLGYQFDRLNTTVNAIAEKNGISTGRKYNNMNQSDSPFKETYRMDAAPSDAIPMREATSMADLLGDAPY